MDKPYTQQMYEADQRYKEKERQQNIAALERAIDLLEGAVAEGRKLRYPVAVLSYELERLRRPQGPRF